MSDPVRVDELVRRGWLRVEDGNHGEQRPRQSEFGSGSTRFIRAADMDGGRVLFESAELINDVALARIRKGIGAPGDILFSHKGTVGKLAVVPLDAPAFVCSPQVTFWRSLDADGIDQRFLYDYLHSNEFSDQWRARKGETDMADYVSLTAQREFTLRLPDIKSQRAIGGLLGAIDDKINLNREINRRLEDLASAFFKSWFVDFDPVVAKRDGKTPVGVPAEALHLFPSHFEDSALGPIPKEWRIAPLDAVADFLNGLALQKYPSAGGDVLPVIKIAELRAETSVGADRCSGVPQEYVIDDGDVVFSWSGSLMVDVWCGGRGALNQHLFKVTSTSFPKWYYLRWIEEHLPEFQAIAADKATTMGHIRRFHLSEAKVLVPPAPLLAAMTSIQEPLLDQVIHNRIESRTLSHLRDTLLGPLLSGEITLKTAEKTVAEVV